MEKAFVDAYKRYCKYDNIKYLDTNDLALSKLLIQINKWTDQIYDCLSILSFDKLVCLEKDIKYEFNKVEEYTYFHIYRIIFDCIFNFFIRYQSIDPYDINVIDSIIDVCEGKLRNMLLVVVYRYYEMQEGEALKYLEQLKPQYDNDSFYSYHSTIILVKKEYFKEAEAHLNKLLDYNLGNNNKAAYMNLLFACLVKRKATKEADTIFDQLEVIYKNNNLPISLRYYIAFNLGCYLFFEKNKVVKSYKYFEYIYKVISGENLLENDNHPNLIDVIDEIINFTSSNLLKDNNITVKDIYDMDKLSISMSLEPEIWCLLIRKYKNLNIKKDIIALYVQNFGSSSIYQKDITIKYRI